MTNKYLSFFSAVLSSIILLSCAVSYTGLKFKNNVTLTEGEDYFMTKDGIKHPYQEIDGFKFNNLSYYLKKNKLSYTESDIIEYRATYIYNKKLKTVKQFRKVDKNFAQKIVIGKINVYLFSDSYTSADLKNHTSNKYYVQKGDVGQLVMLIPQNSKKEIYEMLSDYSPSKVIMDSYLKKKKSIGVKEVVEAINVYNNRLV